MSAFVSSAIRRTCRPTTCSSTGKTTRRHGRDRALPGVVRESPPLRTDRQPGREAKADRGAEERLDHDGRAGGAVTHCRPGRVRSGGRGSVPPVRRDPGPHPAGAVRRPPARSRPSRCPAAAALRSCRTRAGSRSCAPTRVPSWASSSRRSTSTRGSTSPRSFPTRRRVANPVDMIASATAATYAAVVPLLLADADVDALVVLARTHGAGDAGGGRAARSPTRVIATERQSRPRRHARHHAPRRIGALLPLPGGRRRRARPGRRASGVAAAAARARPRARRRPGRGPGRCRLRARDRARRRGSPADAARRLLTAYGVPCVTQRTVTDRDPRRSRRRTRWAIRWRSSSARRACTRSTAAA